MALTVCTGAAPVAFQRKLTLIVGVYEDSDALAKGALSHVQKKADDQVTPAELLPSQLPPDSWAHASYPKQV